MELTYIKPNYDPLDLLTTKKDKLDYLKTRIDANRFSIRTIKADCKTQNDRDFASYYIKQLESEIDKDVKLIGWLKKPKSERKHLDVEAAKRVPFNKLLKLRRVGTRQSAICPLHHDHKPSLVVYPENTWFCFACCIGGDIIKFVQLYKKLSFPEAVQYLLSL